MDRRARPTFLLGLLLLLLALPLGAQGLRVTSTVDRTRLRVGETLVFTLRIQGTSLAIPQPALPPLPGFKSVGTYQSLDNTGNGQVLAFHYLLTPTASGHLEVPDVALRIGGQSVTVPGFAVDVETTAPLVAPQAAPVRPRPSASAGREIFLTGTLSASQAYVGVPVLYTLHLFTRRSVRGLDIVQTPDFSGFRKVEDPNATHSPTHQVTRDSRVYLDAVVIRAILFPLEAGRLSVGPYSAELKLEPDRFGGPALVTGEVGAAELQGRPVPPAPPGFTGAVGSFRLTQVTPIPPRAELGQPFTQTVRIEGTGFLPDQPLTWAVTPLFDSYPPTSEDSSGFDHGIYRTRRLISRSFLPKVAGDATFPPAVLVVFDPAARAFKTLQAGGGRLVVAGGSSGAHASVELMPLVAEPVAGVPPEAPMPLRLFLTLAALPFLCTGAVGAGLWVYTAFLMAPEKRRRRGLHHRARKALRRAHRLMDVRDAEVFHERLSVAMSATLDLWTGRPTAGLQRPQLGEALREAAVPEKTVERVIGVVDALERARYAQEHPTRKEMRDRYASVSRWVKGGPGA